MSVMPVAAVLEMARTGTFACCASGSAALAVFESVGPMMALTLSRWMNFWNTVMPCSLVDPSSSMRTVNFTPPPWLTSSRAAWMPARCWAPPVAAGPVGLRAAPMTAPPPPAAAGPWAPCSLHATAVSSRARGSGHRRARLMASPGCRGLLRYRKRRPFARLGGPMSLGGKRGGGLGGEQTGAVARLCRAGSDRAAAGDALGRRQAGPVLYSVDQEIEGGLRVGLDELELWERGNRRGPGWLVRLDVVAVLDFIEAVRG